MNLQSIFAVFLVMLLLAAGAFGLGRTQDMPGLQGLGVILGVIALCGLVLAALWQSVQSFFWRLLLCLVPLALGSVVCARAMQQFSEGQGGVKLGVDLVGGTILVYETDPESMAANKDFDITKLAEKLKQRIDPGNMKDVVVRPVPPNRVEIVLPTGGGNVERSFSVRQVEEARELISRVGSLRFMILANGRDDKEAMDKAREMYGQKMSADLRAKLEDARMKGKLPEPPEQVTAEGEGFVTPLGRYAYSWVEIGKKYRDQNELENSVEKRATAGSNWQRMAEARKTHGVEEIAGHLFYSREVPPEREARILKKEGEGPKKYEYFVLSRRPEGATEEERKQREVTGDLLSRASKGPGDKGEIAVHFAFKTEGANRFWALTSKNKPDGGFTRQLAIVLDELIETAPSINQAIRNEGQITGNFTNDEADQLVNVLRSGALPATLRPQPVAENTIGATLGNDTVKWGSISVLLAFVAVLVFMLFYYRMAGFVACIALLANLILTVAVMVLVQATFTLPGLAGLVLMLGMAVDANVLIYERLREERGRGASLALAVRNAYDRSFGTIIDTHLSSIFTAVVLYVVGNDQLKGFGISLTLGLIISLFTSLFMTRVMFDVALARNWLHDLSMARLFKQVPTIDFMAIRHYWFTATIILTTLGIALFLARGRSGLNIDFTGGTLYSGQLTKSVTMDELKRALDETVQEARLKVEDATEVEGSKGTQFRVRYQGEQDQTIVLPHPDTAANVKERAGRLPDFAVEQAYFGGEATTGGSRYFTIRTSERAPEVVQAAINRLLDDPENAVVQLKKIQMEFTPPRIHPDTKKQVTELTFVDKVTENPYASESQVRRLLEREFARSSERLSAQSQLFTLQGVSGEETEKDGRFSRMTLTLNPVSDADLTAALKETARSFADRPQPERLEVFDSQLAEETQTRALYAILASWGAILLYLWFRFGNWTFGAAAVLCLVHDLFFTLGLIAVCHYLHDWWFFREILKIQDFKIDLATVAALLTLVGYSVNDTIVVFDRIREVRGKNPELTPKIINDSVNQALGRTLLTSVTVWLVVIVLYIFGGEGVHLFAFVMVVGVIVGTYSSIYIASPLLLIFGEGATRQPAVQGQRRPQPTAG